MMRMECGLLEIFFNIVWLGDFADVFSVLGLTTTTETNWDDITK